MSITVSTRLSLETLGSTLPFGPWTFAVSTTYPKFFGAEIFVSATTLGQIIGGVSPAVTSITEMTFLLVSPNQAVRIGLHGVNAQSAGFTLNASQVLFVAQGSINALSIYNTAAVTALILVAVGGS